MLDRIIKIDKEVLVFLNNLGNEHWDPFWLFVTNQFNWTPVFLLMIFLIIKSFGWKRGGFMILSMIVLVAFSDQFVNFIKDYTQRLRPNNDPEIDHLLRTIINPQSFSFMSGHATTSTFFTVYVTLLLKGKYKYIGLLLFFPVLFSYSRIYLGVHFPLDIFLGIALGTILGNLYFTLYKKIDKVSFAK
ncbi:phosphatase PAP2 family protein [Polaribacter batillariae]|uniref:Phosphatase PAP2 family protein n=1 Tax=Polaribacter batillariae TaxID=2808900 RepID=A0ABX7SXL1_9FLAO|nr:phosphatase PAP2 family protein [Polaribacter batillariae]QTD38213.1 phosphatase PAP2 family protein [Polaribacter batillariae]